MARVKTTNGKKGNSVTAILIDPFDCNITEVRLAVHPLHDDVHANSVNPDDVCRLLDSTCVGAFAMPPIGADVCFYNEVRRRGEEGKGAFRFDETCDEMGGKVLLIGFDLDSHTYKNVSFPIASLRETVIWSKGIKDGSETTPTANDVSSDREFKEPYR